MKLAGVLAAILLFSVSGVGAQSIQAPIQASPYFLVPAAPNFFAAATPTPAALALSAAPGYLSMSPGGRREWLTLVAD